MLSHKQDFNAEEMMEKFKTMNLAEKPPLPLITEMKVDLLVDFLWEKIKCLKKL
jgi:hypothetical protein